MVSYPSYTLPYSTNTDPYYGNIGFNVACLLNLPMLLNNILNINSHGAATIDHMEIKIFGDKKVLFCF